MAAYRELRENSLSVGLCWEGMQRPGMQARMGMYCSKTCYLLLGMQTDASINAGSSGGALLDSGGRLIGISTATFSKKGTVRALPAGRPIHDSQRVHLRAAYAVAVGRCCHKTPHSWHYMQQPVEQSCTCDDNCRRACSVK